MSGATFATPPDDTKQRLWELEWALAQESIRRIFAEAELERRRFDDEWLPGALARLKAARPRRRRR